MSKANDLIEKIAKKTVIGYNPVTKKPIYGFKPGDHRLKPDWPGNKLKIRPGKEHMGAKDRPGVAGKVQGPTADPRGKNRAIDFSKLKGLDKKSSVIMDKVANAAKVKKFMAQGLSYDEAYKKAYPGQGPKDKGVIDPARPEMPKEAFFGTLAKGVGAAGRVAAKTAPKITKSVDKASRAAASNVGKKLLGYGSKHKRVVRLPDKSLWHPNKAGLAATKVPAGGKLTNLIRKYPKTAVGLGALAGGKVVGDRKSEPKSYREKAYLEAGRPMEIMPGQTLSEIAHQHGTSPAKLQEMNQIEDANYIRAGETLRVPTNIIPPKLSPGIQEPQNPTNPTLKKQGSLSKEAFIGNFAKGLGYGAKYLKGLKGLQAAGKGASKATAKSADDIKPAMLETQKGTMLPDGRLSPEAIIAHNKAVAASGKFPNKHIKGVGDVGKPGVAGKDYPLPKLKPGWGIGPSSAPVPAGNVGANPTYTHPLKELYKKWGLD